jgi:rSAM/selenodomain-associated transferase 1
MSAHQIVDPNSGVRVPPNICALGIMTKAPQAGKVKTRLVPPLTAEEAAELNICFLRDLSKSISTVTEQTKARGIGIYTPIGAESVYARVLPNDFFLMQQRGGSFGERLTFAAEDLLNVGFDSVCLINSDSPTVPAASFIEAAKQLAKAGDQLVLGPSEDGGYYLIGLKKLHRGLFQQIEWSTEHVFNQTMQRAAGIGTQVHELPAGFDVDDRVTLARLCDEVLGNESRSKSDPAAHTQKFLRDIVAREGRDRIWPR